MFLTRPLANKLQPLCWHQISKKFNPYIYYYVDKIKYNGEDRIAIILPKDYTEIDESIWFGKSLFEAIEVISSCDETKELIDKNRFLDIIQLAQIASNLM